MKRVIWILVWLFLSGNVFPSELQKEVQAFLSENFPLQKFEATPFGADSRYEPKTMWAYLGNLARPGKPRSITKGWVAFSDGKGVYPENLAKLRCEPISVSSLKTTAQSKIALGAAISGTISAVPIDANTKADWGSSMVVDVDFGEVEIAYVYYFDMLVAQESRADVLQRMHSLLSKREGAPPPIKVVCSALRIRNAQISVRSTKTKDSSFSAKYGVVLGSLGFSWNGEKEAFQNIKYTDWRYIAFESLEAKPGTIEISEAQAVLDTSTLRPEENAGSFLAELFKGP